MMIKGIKGKTIKGIEEALREQIAYEKKVRKTFERMAIRLKQQVNELEAELCGLEDELGQANREIEELKAKNVMLQNTIDSMRWRIFTLLRSTDVDAEAIGLPRYTKPKADELRSMEEICEIDPGEEGWWPKEGLFEQSGDKREESGDNPYIEVVEDIELSEAPEGQDIISAAKRAIDESIKKLNEEKLHKILKEETWEEQLGHEL